MESDKIFHTINDILEYNEHRDKITKACGVE